MKLEILNQIVSRQLIAPTKRASLYEGNAFRLLQRPARHWRTAHLDGLICREGSLWPARQMPIIAVCRGLRTMGKRVQTW